MKVNEEAILDLLALAVAMWRRMGEPNQQPRAKPQRYLPQESNPRHIQSLEPFGLGPNHNLGERTVAIRNARM